MTVLRFVVPAFCHGRLSVAKSNGEQILIVGGAQFLPAATLCSAMTYQGCPVRIKSAAFRPSITMARG